MAKSELSKGIINKISKSTTYTSNEDFKLVIGRGSAITTIKELRNTLVKKFDIDIDDVSDVSNDILIELSHNYTGSKTNNEIIVEVLTPTSTDKMFFNRLKYTTDKGHKVWMFKKTNDNMEITIIESKTNDISQSYASLLAKYGLYNIYKKKYIHLCETDPYSLAIIDNIITKGTENQSVFSAPSFDEYLYKTLKIIGADESMFVDNLPMPISNNNETPCFFYFNPTIIQQGEWWIWQEFINRFPSDSHREVFMEWLWLVFIENLTCEQKMYIRGEGADGKSTIIKVISEFMSYSCYVIQSGSLKGNHWGAKVYDKRLVIHSDSKNPKPLDNEKSHLATDIIDVEKKYEAGFTYQANYMELFMSNDIPEINDVKNERRRLIYIPLGKMSDNQLKRFCKLDDNGEVMYDDKGDFIVLGNSDYKNDLAEQFPAFLYECQQVYLKNNNGQHNNVFIPPAMEKSMFEEIVDIASEFVYITSEFISACTDGHIKAYDLKLLYENTGLKKEIKSYNAFIRLLQLKYPEIKKVTIQPKKDDKFKAYKAYKGICFDSDFESKMVESHLDRIEELRDKVILGRKALPKRRKISSNIEI